MINCKKLILIISVVFITISCEKGSSPELADLDDIPTLLKHYGVPGISFAVVDNYKIVDAQAFGVVDSETQEIMTTDTLLQAASISKPVTAMAAIKIAQDKGVNFTGNVNDYLVSWHIGENENTSKEKVTLDRIITHKSGINVHGFRGYRIYDEIPTLLQILNGNPPANSEKIDVGFEPGKKYKYSGGGFIVLQQVLIDIYKEDFPSILNRTVLGSIGMNNSTFESPLESDNPQKFSSGHTTEQEVVEGRFHIYPELAAAGLWTNPTDLAKFLIEIQLSLKGQSNLVLNEGLSQKMVSSTGPLFQLSNHFEHSGSNYGFVSEMISYNENGAGIVVMSNSNNGWPVMRAIEEHVIKVNGWISSE